MFSPNLLFSMVFFRDLKLLLSNGCRLKNSRKEKSASHDSVNGKRCTSEIINQQQIIPKLVNFFCRFIYL